MAHQDLSSYTVPIATLRNNAEALRSFVRSEYGPDLLDKLNDIELVLAAQNPDDRVPIESVSMAIDGMANFLDERNLGLKMAEHLEKTYTRVVIFSNHVGVRFVDYLHMIARYMRITTEIFAYDIVLSDSEIEFRLIPISPETLSYHQTEGLCALIMRAFQSHNVIRLSRIQFAHAQPSENTDLYLEHFGQTPTFSQSYSSLFFPLECRDVLINEVEESEDSIRVLQSYEMQFSKLSKDICITERCEFLLPLLLCLGQANKERLADLLCMSTRTLQRKLKERDTSFRELLQKVRVDLSKHYFLKENASCTELAFALGYQDYKQFNRAFKEWFDIAPEDFRAKVLSGRGAE